MSLKILLIDDSRLSRTVTRHLMESLQSDIQIFEAHDGASAIVFLESHSVDIAIIDINMPGLSGLDLIAIIREKCPGIRLGILSANVQEGVRKKADELQVHFFTKPVTEESVRYILTTLA